MLEKINSCNWDSAPLLIFSENVFDPLIYYSHIGPFILAFIIGLLAFFGDRKRLQNNVLIWLMIFFCIWDFSDLVLWATEKIDYVMFFWSVMIFFDLLIYVAAFFLTYIFIRKKDLFIFLKILLLIPFIPLLLFVATNYNLEFFNLMNCEREAQEGILWNYVYSVEAVFIFLIIIEGVLGFFRNREDSKTRIETVLFVMGVVLFLVTFSLGNIIGMISDDWSLGQYGLFGMSIFSGFLAYLVVKFKSFNVRLFASQVFVFLFVFLIGTLFLNKSDVIVLITFILAIFSGWFMIKSIQTDHERRDQLQYMADKLAQSNDQLRKLDNAKTEFISIASHQLRTPLTAIKGFVSLIIEGTYGEVNDTVKTALGKIYLSGERLINLVENLLSISRIESGRMEYHLEPVQVEDVIKELEEGFSMVAENKGLYLDLKFPEKPLPKVLADYAKIREVFSNFIDNALKYTKRGGVTVYAEYHEGIMQMFQAFDDQNPSHRFVRVTVADTGVGVPKSEVQYLFVKFSRGKDVTRLNVGGTGLGLYVAKNIIDAHGGKVWVESEGEGLGSRFIVELPVA